MVNSKLQNKNNLLSVKGAISTCFTDLDSVSKMEVVGLLSDRSKEAVIIDKRERSKAISLIVILIRKCETTVS